MDLKGLHVENAVPSTFERSANGFDESFVFDEQADTVVIHKRMRIDRVSFTQVNDLGKAAAPRCKEFALSVHLTVVRRMADGAVVYVQPQVRYGHYSETDTARRYSRKKIKEHTALEPQCRNVYYFTQKRHLCHKSIGCLCGR